VVLNFPVLHFQRPEQRLQQQQQQQRSYCSPILRQRNKHPVCPPHQAALSSQYFTCREKPVIGGQSVSQSVNSLQVSLSQMNPRDDLRGEPKRGHRLMTIILSNLNRFKNCFHWKIPW